MVFRQQTDNLGGGSTGLGHGLGDILGALTDAGQEDTAVGLSTGRSLGWASVKKSLVSMEAVSMVAMERALSSGSMAAARMTISASIWNCSLLSKSDA